MSTLVIPEPTIEEQALEDFDPIPQLALAHWGAVQTPFQLALPTGRPRCYETTFEIEHDLDFNQGAVRYSLLIPPAYIPMRKWFHVRAGDKVHVVLQRGLS